MADLLGPIVRWARAVAPRRAEVRSDALAGLPTAIASVPDGMAASLLAGVSPVAGLYACFAAPITGGLSTSTRLMVITTTNAAALAAGSALAGVAPNDRIGSLVLLTLFAAVLMIVAGLCHLGRFTRFVSHSVMIGFLTGVSVNIALGQIANLCGVKATGRVGLVKAFHVIQHPSQIDLASLACGLGAIAVLVVLARTRAARVSALIALIVPTLVVAVVGADSVARVSDTGTIPKGVPAPHLPDFGSFHIGVLTGALAVAAIVLVQGAGVRESVPNVDHPSDPDRDFVAQGIGNLASSFFRGIPVGASVGETALSTAGGARSRWAGIFAGAWMLLILVAFGGLVGKVALPTLSGVLIFAAVGALRVGQLNTIMRTGPTSRVAVVTTFVATLLLPIAAAVGIGVALSLLLQLNQEALDLSVVALRPDDDGNLVEGPAPDHLTSHQVVVLDVYGSLLYAGSRTLQARLPEPEGAIGPAVVLRLRGRTTLGSTFVVVITDYATRLEAVGGRLYLSGLDPVLVRRLRRAGRVHHDGPIRLYEAQPVLGRSTRDAFDAAESWIIEGDRGVDDDGASIEPN